MYVLPRHCTEARDDCVDLYLARCLPWAFSDIFFGLPGPARRSFDDLIAAVRAAAAAEACGLALMAFAGP